MQQIFTPGEPMVLECGRVLPEPRIAYHTYGSLNSDKSNVIWVCHALTADSDAAAWWPGMIGSQCPMDTGRYFVICANIIGSCYGSTGPLDTDPASGNAYYRDFPPITIRDMVQAHILLRRHLGITRIALLAGGSMGGYQALEWALAEPACIERLFLLATSAAESAWGIAIHTAQRLAIEADSSFNDPRPGAGARGLKAARAIGMLSYRNYELMVAQQTDPDNNKTRGFKASSYINYQGDKLVARFNAHSYHVLSEAMDSHNLARARCGSADEALSAIRQPTLLIGISSDILCPPAEQRRMASSLPHCRYEEISSPYGHDGFLVETAKTGLLLQSWLCDPGQEHYL